MLVISILLTAAQDLNIPLPPRLSLPQSI